MSPRKPTRRVLITTVALSATVVVAGALLLGGAFDRPFEPQYAEPSFVAPKMATNEAITPAAEDADQTDVLDVTDEVAADFAFTLSDVRSRIQGDTDGEAPAVSVDPCLTQWANENLAALSATGTFEILTVCDRQTVVVSGAGGADVRVLTYGSIEDSAPVSAQEMLAESTNTNWGLVALRTADGKASIVAATALPDAD